MRFSYPAGANRHRESDYTLTDCERQELDDLYLASRAIIYEPMQQLRPERFQMLSNALPEGASRSAVRVANMARVAQTTHLGKRSGKAPSQHLHHSHKLLRRINYMTSRLARQRLPAFYQYRAASKFRFHKPTGYLL